ncbi:MAG: sulfur oxidation c-type cytochrome SoxX [Lamprocystis purpurea]|jgi:sulfur-oxidizing protein SoxX|uniref:sulfur oxidation c-type cytochrome SoxX n=1 Tax=Lamprocystis purpurea TaxID=61598 RepID=UPI000361EEA9|nr:sulfur oxidation c-type cytochrome SoxX [Lamprocystis purpurea]MBV5274611.1 sulfur oxidation c-type cytochrome SoxX [Lamprocystis purpurea]
MKFPSISRRRAPALILGALAITAVGVASEMPKIDLTSGDPAAGKAIAMDRSKGNCIACHLIIGGESPGAIGPALIAMQTRYPTKEALAIQIWDATVKTPEAAMPPFGRHAILSQQELADVVAYVWTL